MKVSVGIVCIFLALIPAQASTTKKTGFSAPVEYQGGTLALNQGKLTVTISENDIVFYHRNRKVLVPLKNITAISCSNDSRRRFGATILGVVPRMHLDTEEEYFIGLTWTGGEQPSRNEAVLKLSGGEYRQLLAALERGTGKKAINTRQVPTAVQYGL